MTMHDAAWAQHPLLASRRREFLDAPIHALTMAETLAIADEAMAAHRPLHHVVVNVAKLVNMRKNAELHDDVITADLINVDGKGVLWGARLCGVSLPERVTGVDVMINVLALCAEKGYRPFLRPNSTFSMRWKSAGYRSPEPGHCRQAQRLFQGRGRAGGRPGHQRFRRGLPVRGDADAEEGALPQALPR